MTPAPGAASEATRQSWQDQWQHALGVWGRFIRLADPLLCLTSAQAQDEGLSESFAMTRLLDRQVVIDLQQIEELGLVGLPCEVLAHEVGHHVLCPASITEQAQMLARMRVNLPGCEEQAPMLANLYADLFINDRLQRSERLHMAEVYMQLNPPQPSGLWRLYVRAYEVLWQLPRGSLSGAALDDATEGDARLAARVIRVYARDWMAGAGGFAALCFPYVSALTRSEIEALRVRSCASRSGEMPTGLAELDDDEARPARHPGRDPRVVGELADDGSDQRLSEVHQPPSGEQAPNQLQRHRAIGDYRDILRQLGVTISDADITVRYYRERALPHIVRFPSVPAPQTTEPLPEGLDTWDMGSPLEQADWTESVIRSPIVIPGVTTVERTWGEAPGAEPEREPLDLDLYVDSSGSMPNPRNVISYLALAGTIMAISALRAGARVQVTLWSGPGQTVSTRGFERDETSVLRVITGSLGGATQFPLEVLAETYGAPRRGRRAHIMVISDDGVITMFEGLDATGRPNAETVASALAACGGGGTLLLNWDGRGAEQFAQMTAPDWSVHRVQNWEDLVTFAREFVHRAYSMEER